MDRAYNDRTFEEMINITQELIGDSYQQVNTSGQLRPGCFFVNSYTAGDDPIFGTEKLYNIKYIEFD